MSDLPSVRIEIPAREWGRFRVAVSWCIRRSYVDHLTIKTAALAEGAFISAHKGRRKNTKTPAVVLLPREACEWVANHVMWKVHEQAFPAPAPPMTVAEASEELKARAERIKAQLLVEVKKTVIDFIGEIQP